MRQEQGYLYGMPPQEACPKAEAAAKKALSFDERSSDAHHALGVVRLFLNWNFGQAENPEKSWTSFNILMTQGRHSEAVDWCLRMLGRPFSGNPGLAAALKNRFEKEGIHGFLRARLDRMLEGRTTGGNPGRPWNNARANWAWKGRAL